MGKNKFTTAQKYSQRFLRSIRLAERRIQIYEAEIELQQSRLLLNGVSGGENVSSTLSGDAQEQGFVRLYELCDALDTDLIGYVEERDEGLRVISNLNDQNQYDVIYLRYFRGLTFTEISNIIYKSESQVYDYHAKALSNLYRFIPNEYKQKPICKKSE